MPRGLLDQPGLPFIATHPDLVCPTDEPTVLVDCGSICACLTAATGRRPLVLGKPDPGILLELVRAAGLAPRQLAMVGDRIYTDMAMAQKAGAMAVLVLSGEATAADAAAMSAPADLVVADIGEFGAESARSKRYFSQLERTVHHATRDGERSSAILASSGSASIRRSSGAMSACCSS